VAISIKKSQTFIFIFTVARFAAEKIQPLVRQMDAESKMDQSIIDGMFENGVSWSVHYLCNI
jgi:hypothetical protein